MKSAARNRSSRPFARLVLLLAAGAATLPAQASMGARELARLSLEELSELVVTTVHKDPEPLGSAPAAIYVITRADIARYGATTLAEALRLAPNLQVARSSSYGWVVAPRGFAGNEAAQNFPNKLLVLIDGRSVYSPLFSGLYWDSQEVLLDDVERIEVISGPGATLWGANAMNGVINVITRRAAETRGTLLAATAGERERRLALRQGFALGEDAALRVYAKGVEFDATRDRTGASREDDWRRAQGGFRLDWNPGKADALTVQGDVYDGRLGEPGPGDLDIRGSNLLARWRRAVGADGELEVQAYHDRLRRGASLEGVPYTIHTTDAQLRHATTLGGVHRIVWGFGERYTRYDIDNTPTLLFVPPRRSLSLRNVFLQDTIALGERLRLTLGLKLEDDPYSSWTPLPEARLAWTSPGGTLLYASGARAVRAATPFDVDVVERVGGIDFVVGNPDFRAEELDAYELGYRGRPLADLSLSVTAFYHRYDELRSIELAPTGFLPLRWGNGMEGHTYGVEAWADWRVTPWWQLSPGYRRIEKRLRYEPGASRLLGLAQAGHDPVDTALLNSSMDLGERVGLDALLRYQAPVSAVGLPAYHQLDLRLSWRVRPGFELALRGRDVLGGRHREYTTATSSSLGRSASLEMHVRL